MAMTRKYCREAAEIIRRNLPTEMELTTPITRAEIAVLRQVAAELADMFKADNSNFRREQFMEACGL